MLVKLYVQCTHRQEFGCDTLTVGFRMEKPLYHPKTEITLCDVAKHTSYSINDYWSLLKNINIISPFFHSIGFVCCLEQLTHPHTSPESEPSLQSPEGVPEPQSCGSCRSLQERAHNHLWTPDNGTSHSLLRSYNKQAPIINACCSWSPVGKG